MLEVYFDKINDLLDPRNQNLDIKQNPIEGTFVEGLSEMTAATDFETLEKLELGNQNRKTGEVDKTQKSPRSHSFF